MSRTGPHHHWARLAALAVTLTAVAGIAALVAAYVLREQPGARSIDDAVGQYRGAAAPEDGDPSATARPEPGVYTADGSGTESISFPPVSQHDGTVLPVSVQHLDGGCFRVRVDYNEAHWHHWDFCRTPDGLAMGPQENFLRWDFGTVTVENTSRFDCDDAAVIPLDAEPGTTATGTCAGTNTATPGETVSREAIEVLGTREVRLGDRTVEVVTIGEVAVLSGAQTGENRATWSFEPSTGLPVAVERIYRIETASPVGTITYTEEGEWQLRDLEPRR